MPSKVTKESIIKDSPYADLCKPIGDKLFVGCAKKDLC